MICAFDFSEDRMPLEAIIPKIASFNYAMEYEELMTLLWQDVFGTRVREIGGEREFEIHDPAALTPRLHTVEGSDLSFKVNRVRWDLQGSGHRTGILSRFRYRRSSDSTEGVAFPFAEIWSVESNGFLQRGSGLVQQTKHSLTPRSSAVLTSTPSVPRRFS